MKLMYRHAVGLTGLSLLMSAGADVIYSNLQDITIPEPGSWLVLGCLVDSGAFLRSRHREKR
jgi:hypothetical protein